MPKKGSKYKIYKYDPYVSIPRATRYYQSKRINNRVVKNHNVPEVNIERSARIDESQVI